MTLSLWKRKKAPRWCTILKDRRRSSPANPVTLKPEFSRAKVWCEGGYCALGDGARGGGCWPFVPTLIPTTSVPSLLYHPTFSGAKIVVSGEVMSSNAFIMRPMKFTLPALSGPLGDRKRGIGMTLDWYFELCSSTFFFRYLLH